MSTSSPPVLRPLWLERNRLLRLPDGRPLPGVGTRAMVEGEVDEALRQIASGQRVWPPRNTGEWRVLGPTDPRRLAVAAPFPPRFDWRHPACFANLPTMQVMRRAQLEDFRRRGWPYDRAEPRVDLSVNTVYAQAMFAHHGRRVYYIDTGMAELLLQTPVPSLPASVLRIPLHGFCLALPEDRFEAAVEGDPVPQPVDGVMVAVDRVAAEDGDTSTEPRDLSVLVTCRSPKAPSDDNVLYAGLTMGPDAPLDTLRLRHLDTRSELADDILRLVIGLVLYLQSDHPSLEPVPAPELPDLSAIKNPTKRRKAEQRAARQSRLGFIWVGRREGAGLDVAALPRGSGRGWHLDRQVWVSGHWRQQPYGPARQLRRPQWIRPYLKGPDFAEATELRRARVHPARPVDE